MDQSFRKTLRLLVVEENEGFFELLRSSAEVWNSEFEVDCRYARSEEEAMRLVPELLPDLVLVDAYLEGLSNFEILREENSGYLPVVVSGPRPCEELAQSASKIGALAYISKTEDPDDLEQILYKLASLAAAHQHELSKNFH